MDRAANCLYQLTSDLMAAIDWHIQWQVTVAVTHSSIVTLILCRLQDAETTGYFVLMKTLVSVAEKAEQ